MNVYVNSESNYGVQYIFYGEKQAIQQKIDQFYLN